MQCYMEKRVVKKTKSRDELECLQLVEHTKHLELSMHSRRAETEKVTPFKAQEKQRTKSQEQLQMEVLLQMFKTLIKTRKEQPETGALSKEQIEQETELLQLVEELKALRRKRTSNQPH